MKAGNIMPLTQVFVSISDPRSARHKRHDLAELLTVAVCAVLSGVDDFVDIELWAKAKIDWLRGFMKLEHGIPSHDTIGRVFGLIRSGNIMPLTQVFVSISDPRSARHKRHDLAELLTVAVCAVLSGVDDFVDIELWAKAKIDWLRGFMKLEHGIPSHDTIGRVFGLI